jgi:hypothetical protein
MPPLPLKCKRIFRGKERGSIEVWGDAFRNNTGYVKTSSNCHEWQNNAWLQLIDDKRMCLTT